jgi:hypothetical protein
MTATHFSWRDTATTTLLLAALVGCGTTSGQMAGQGAGQGAAAGAAGGLLTAVIFGGDPIAAAARGAAWGAGAGAVSGAIQGSRIDDQRAAQEEQQEIARIKSEIGNDSFAGLEALVDCKHDVALGYAKQAMKARNRDHALAGLWLEVISYADRGDRKTARSLLPTIVTQSPEIADTTQATTTLNETLQGLADIRSHYGLAKKCRGTG